MNNKLIVFLLNKELFEIDKYRYEFDNFDLPNIKYEIHDLQEVINKKKIFDKDLNTIQNTTRPQSHTAPRDEALFIPHATSSGAIRR